MPVRSLEEVFEEYGSALGPEAPEIGEMARFREFLVTHAGFRTEESGRAARIVGRPEALRCFHFSQYLDWYLSGKAGLPPREGEAAREAMNRFNEWLLKNRIIHPDDSEENREAILGSEEGPLVYEEVGAPDEATGMEAVVEERDFYVPGEYTSLLSGEFVITKVQEGILYGRRDGDPCEVGPILVDRAVSGGSRVGDRVHLTLGRAGEHWNLLGFGRRQE